jgi:hypothetical protein
VSSDLPGPVSRVAIASSSLACHMCLRRHLEVWVRCARVGESPASGDAARKLPTEAEAEMAMKRFEQVSVAIRGAPLELVADRCLVNAAAALGTTVTAISALIVEGLLDDAKSPACGHAVVVDGRLCTYLAYALDPETVGLVNVADLAADHRGGKARVTLPIAKELFEAQPEESALSYAELMGLTEWIPASCERYPEPRRWGHIVLVSHVWPGATVPGTRADLDAIKQCVRTYVDWQLEENAKQVNPRVKATRPEEFGIWIDYMIVPNEEAHADCAKCAARKDALVAKINGLLTVATVLYMSPDSARRGWILQEMSGNSHASNQRAVTPLGHRDRARLMARQVEFTKPEDGSKLRCYEFLRLGQSPRAWPAVNVVLLDQLEQGGQVDEGSPEARPILLRLARSFDLPCHDLKRLMIDLTQELATNHQPWLVGGMARAVDLGPLVRALDDQGSAMKVLSQRINADARGDLISTNLDERIGVTRRLQLQQFVGVAMGLRAEWIHGDSGAGLAPWIWVSVIADALAGAKFMARLKALAPDGNGQGVNVSESNRGETSPMAGIITCKPISEGMVAEVRHTSGRIGFAGVTSVVGLHDPPPASAARYASAKRVSEEGVDIETVAHIYARLSPAS